MEQPGLEGIVVEEPGVEGAGETGLEKASDAVSVVSTEPYTVLKPVTLRPLFLPTMLNLLSTSPSDQSRRATGGGFVIGEVVVKGETVEKVDMPTLPNAPAKGSEKEGGEALIGKEVAEKDGPEKEDGGSEKDGAEKEAGGSEKEIAEKEGVSRDSPEDASSFSECTTQEHDVLPAQADGEKATCQMALATHTNDKSRDIDDKNYGDGVASMGWVNYRTGWISYSCPLTGWVSFSERWWYETFGFVSIFTVSITE